jgi:hypothetical protein
VKPDDIAHNGAFFACEVLFLDATSIRRSALIAGYYKALEHIRLRYGFAVGVQNLGGSRKELK